MRRVYKTEESHGDRHAVADSATIESMSNPDLEPDPESERERGNLTARIGVALILLSGVLWFSLFAIPFLPLTAGQKAALAGVDFIGVQIAWWTGATLAAPETVRRMKALFQRRQKVE